MVESDKMKKVLWIEMRLNRPIPVTGQPLKCLVSCPRNIN